MSAEHGPRKGAKRTAQFCALLLSLTASTVLAVMPSYSSATYSDGVQSAATATLIEVSGLGILVPLMVPALLTALPLVTPRRLRQLFSILTTAGLALFCVAGALSLGPFYLPALAAAVVAAVLKPHRLAAPNSAAVG